MSAQPMVLHNTSTDEWVEYPTPEKAMQAYARLSYAPELRLHKREDFTPPVAKQSEPVAMQPEPSMVGRVYDSSTELPEETKAMQVSSEAVERIERHAAAARAMGFEPTPPIYTLGMRVIGYGDNRFNELREEYETLPETSKAWEGISNTIVNEDRVDLVVSARDLAMEDDGRLVVPGYGNITVERRAFANLLSKFRMETPEDTGMDSYDGKPVRGNQIFPSAGPVMARMQPDLRAHVFNQMSCETDGELMLKLRTRDNNGKRSLFATVSPGYAVIDADQIAEMVGSSSAMEGSRAHVFYNPETTNVSVDAIWMPNERPRNLAAGDFFKAGFRFRTNDSGTGALRGGGILYRNLCLNLLIVAKDYAPMIHIRHWGDAKNIEAQLIDATRKVREGMSVILGDWGVVANTLIDDVELWGQTFHNVEEALIWAVENEKIGKSISSKVLQENLLKGLAFEQGDTPIAFINAVTRAAWEEKFSETERWQLEREAGELIPLFAKAVAE